MSNVKILVCGDVKGRIADLMKRLVSSEIQQYFK